MTGCGKIEVERDSRNHESAYRTCSEMQTGQAKSEGQQATPATGPPGDGEGTRYALKCSRVWYPSTCTVSIVLVLVRAPFRSSVDLFCTGASTKEPSALGANEPLHGIRLPDGTFPFAVVACDPRFASSCMDAALVIAGTEYEGEMKSGVPSGVGLCRCFENPFQSLSFAWIACMHCVVRADFQTATDTRGFGRMVR